MKLVSARLYNGGRKVPCFQHPPKAKTTCFWDGVYMTDGHRCVTKDFVSVETTAMEWFCCREGVVETDKNYLPEIDKIVPKEQGKYLLQETPIVYEIESKKCSQFRILLKRHTESDFKSFVIVNNEIYKEMKQVFSDGSYQMTMASENDNMAISFWSTAYRSYKFLGLLMPMNRNLIAEKIIDSVKNVLQTTIKFSDFQNSAIEDYKAEQRKERLKTFAPIKRAIKF